MLSPAGFKQQAPNSSLLSRLPLASGPCPAPAECSRLRRPTRRSSPRCSSCIQRALAARHQLTNNCRNGRKHRPSPARPASSCRLPLWPCAYTARIASRSQSPGASSLALLAGAGGAQVRAQHAAARPKQSNRRSSRIQRRKMPCWSGCRRYWWAVRAQSKLDAQRSKVSTLVPNSLRSASQRVI